MQLTAEQQYDIASLRREYSLTYRPVSEYLESILFLPKPVLNHGFLRVVDYMGDDAAVLQAARLSYGRGTKKKLEDAGLLQYLMRHWHTTPFEMCEIKFHVKMPIFVARQWVRHRTANINEYSARYSVLDNEFYVPGPEQLAVQSSTNRQGRSNQLLSPEQAHEVMRMIKDESLRDYSNYRLLLNEDDDGKPLDPAKDGLARELARMGLGLNFYTQWYWKTDLHNLFNFLRLRADPHAQYEIRVYAEHMLDIVKGWVPMSAEAFINHRVNSITMSGNLVTMFKALMSGASSELLDPVEETDGFRWINPKSETLKQFQVSQREWDDFKKAMA